EYTLARTREVYSTYYDVKYPGHERSAGRPLRVSPAYPRLKELGAAFGEKSGWERANWFEPNAARGDESLRPRGWAGRLWSPAIEAEHRACRESAAVFDFTSFAKIEVRGGGAAAFLEQLCDNQVARGVGRLTYTQMLNHDGGIECDFTVTRLGDRRFRIVTGTAFGRHDLSWIQEHAPRDGSVEVEDVTSAYACIGLVAGGYKAVDSLRLEKGYRVWGSDIGPEVDPYQAGLGFCVKLDKGEFIGRQALVGKREAPADTRLACLVLDEPHSVALGSEPVRIGGRITGRVTSGGYGYSVGRSIAYAFVPA